MKFFLIIETFYNFCFNDETVLRQDREPKLFYGKMSTAIFLCTVFTRNTSKKKFSLTKLYIHYIIKTNKYLVRIHCDMTSNMIKIKSDNW